MLTAGRVAIRFGRNRLANLKDALNGRPLALPSLGSTTLDREDVVAAVGWLRNPSSWEAREPVDEFETAFASWNGSPAAFAFDAGRVALSACIHALGLQPGDQVIVPGYTCVVVPNAFAFAGVKVVYCDIELGTFGPDVASVERCLSRSTRAIVIQHSYGLVCRDYEELLDLARRRRLRVIEDCAHSTGAEYRGRKVGTAGDVGFYSLEQSKVLTTIQGGIAVANDPAIAKRLRSFRDQAPSTAPHRVRRLLESIRLNYYQFKHPQRWWLAELAEGLIGHHRLESTTAEEMHGFRPSHYGCRMSGPMAAIGSIQLGKIDRYNRQRRETAVRWNSWCREKGYSPPTVLQESVPVFLRYPLLVEEERKRDTTWATRDPGVTVGVWFLSHTHPAPCTVPACPNAAEAVRRCINFPCLV